MADKLRIAVAASGSGTCFQSVLDNIKEGRLDAEVVQLITDKPDCKAVERAKKYRIPVTAVEVPKIKIKHPEDTPSDYKPLSNKERRMAARVIHEERLIKGFDGMPGLLEMRPQHLVMLGYMRVLSEYFVGACRREAIGIWNTHPGPIPEYRGENGYGWGVGKDKEAIEPNRWHCVTFHNVADAAFDTGAVLSCSPLEIAVGEDEDSLKERGMQHEYEQIRQCLQWMAEKRIAVNRDGFEVLDGNGLGYGEAMRLAEYFSKVDHDRFVVTVDTSADKKKAELSWPVDVNVHVAYLEHGKREIKDAVHQEEWSASGIPYNLAFTYARQAVEQQRRKYAAANPGNEDTGVQFYFDGIDIHPVVMKKDIVG